MEPAQSFRFGDFAREASLDRHRISYNSLAPKIERDAEGKIFPYEPPKVQLRSIDIYNLIRPYTQVRFMEQLKAVVPLALYLVMFQIFFLRQMVEDSWIITGGLFAVIAGLMLFMEGLKLGLMPLGEAIGITLPKKSPLPAVLTIAFLLGVGVTFEHVGPPLFPCPVVRHYDAGPQGRRVPHERVEPTRLQALK